MELNILIKKIRKYIFSPLAIKDKLKIYFYEIFYKNLYKKPYKSIMNLNICSIDKTISILNNSNKSISRFGDGEFRWLLNDCHNSFQKSSKKLSNQLKKVIESRNDNLIIGLPDSFRGLSNYTFDNQKFWKVFIAEYGKKILPYLSNTRIYYNANISRLYMDYRSKSKSKYYFHKLKQLWNLKNVLIIEGNESRLGVGDDLFNNVKSLYRIECPATNAFDYYNDILNYSKKILSTNPNILTLLSLGPTATVLAYDLSKCGYRAIDIGNIDIEYNWCLMGTHKKVNIPGKYINEAPGGTAVKNIHNTKYNKEIIQRIG